MTAAAILIALEDYLRPLVEEMKGDLTVAETEYDVMAALAMAPTKFRIVLACLGDKAAEDSGRSGAVIGKFSVFVQSPLGLAEDQGKSLHRESTAAGPAFLDRLHAVIKLVRAVEFDDDFTDEQESFNYRGWEWLKFLETNAWRTAQASFELLFAHDDPATESESDPLVIARGMTFEKVGAYLHVTVAGTTTRVRLLEVPA